MSPRVPKNRADFRWNGETDDLRFEPESVLVNASVAKAPGMVVSEEAYGMLLTDRLSSGSSSPTVA